jgi:hypothetical protein
MARPASATATAESPAIQFRCLRRRSRSARRKTSNAQQPRNDLSQRETLAVTFVARVGRQELDRLLRQAPITIELELERLRKALELRVAGLAPYD